MQEDNSPEWQFDSALGGRLLCEQLQVASLAGFNAQGLKAAQAAAAALLSYTRHTPGQAPVHVRELQVERANELLELPPTTHRNLELVQTLRGETGSGAPTLLGLLDSCRTGMGSRFVRHWLTHPTRDRAPAAARHDAIEQFLAHGPEPLREALRSVSDVERARTGIDNLRVQFNKVHGFYIEVTMSGPDKVPADYQRRQTLKNDQRYITHELKATARQSPVRPAPRPAPAGR